MNYGITVIDFNFSALITMTVTVTEPDFIFKFDWKRFRYKRYIKLM